MRKTRFFQLLLLGAILSLAYLVMMLILGITAINYNGNVGIKILSVIAIQIFSAVIYYFYGKKGLIYSNLFYSYLMIFGAVLFMLILYLAPTINYITQPEMMLYGVDRNMFFIFSIIVSVVNIWIVIKIFALKKQRAKLAIVIAEKLQNYAILDFLGSRVVVDNYTLAKDDVMIGNYWNDVFAIKGGKYTLRCDFLYFYTGLGRRGLCTSLINNIKINLDLMQGKQYRIRLAEGEYVIEDAEQYKINMTIAVKRKINLHEKELSILVEEKL